jgi:hypothetical protein
MVCIPTATALEERADSFHFFSRYAPWNARCNASTDSIPPRLACRPEAYMQKHLRQHGAEPACVGHTAALATWFSLLGALPARARRICAERLLAHGAGGGAAAHADAEQNGTALEFGYSLVAREGK